MIYFLSKVIKAKLLKKCLRHLFELEEYEYDFKYFPTGTSVVLRNRMIWSALVAIFDCDPFELFGKFILNLKKESIRKTKKTRQKNFCVASQELVEPSLM